MIGSKTVLFVGLTIVVLMCLFPPYVGEAQTERETRDLKGGYYFVFEPPAGEHRNSGRSEYTEIYHLDYTRLAVQLLAVLLLTLGIAHALRPSEAVDLTRPRFDDEDEAPSSEPEFHQDR